MAEATEGDNQAEEEPEQHTIEKAGEEEEENDKQVEAQKFVLHVGNLSFETTEETLRSLFSKYENLIAVSIPKTREQKSRGFCFVEYSDESSAKAAMENLNETTVEGRQIKVQMSNSKPLDAPKPQEKSGKKGNWKRSPEKAKEKKERYEQWQENKRIAEERSRGGRRVVYRGRGAPRGRSFR